jgi:hypothetical protein
MMTDRQNIFGKAQKCSSTQFSENGFSKISQKTETFLGVNYLS